MTTSAPRDASHQVAFSRIVRAVADARDRLHAGASLNTVLKPALQALPVESRPLAQALIYESVRKQALTEALLSMLCSRAPAPAVRALLESALAALYLGRLSVYAVVSETVTAAKASPVTRGAAGFINAVLRNFIRQRETLTAKAEDLPEVRFNAPRWWVDRIRACWPEQAEEILTIGTRHPPMTLRVNVRRQSVENYETLLQQAGLPFRRIGPEALMLEHPVPTDQIPGFDDGLCSVQDAGTQLAAHLLPVKTGDKVLDACSAPGGKTAHILERTDCHMTALDIDPERTNKIRETLSRLGLKADVRTADAADTASWAQGAKFDQILLDAPCTASGVVRRQPDTPWLRRPEDVRKLAAQQRKLLQALWPLLNPGGYMLYATCSIFPEEGEQQIHRFLSDTPNAELVPLLDGNDGILPLLPAENLQWSPDDILPAVHDGFFYALLRKKSS